MVPLGLVALILVVGAFLAAWTAWRAVDPPYRGVHERRGRHRQRDWEGE